MHIDLFAHFNTQEFRQAYLSIPLGAKGRRLDPMAIPSALPGPSPQGTPAVLPSPVLPSCDACPAPAHGTA